MKISDILNPSRTTNTTETTRFLYDECHYYHHSTTRLASPPLSPHYLDAPSMASSHGLPSESGNYGKPRNRFSEYEDAVICQGVARGLTWGQISEQLPHRKRATCFNRYRTLQGIRKSRKIKSMLHQRHYHHHQDDLAAAAATTTTIFTPSPSPPPPLTPLSSDPCFHNTNSAITGNGDMEVFRLTPTSAFFTNPHHWPSAWVTPGTGTHHEKQHRHHRHSHFYGRY